jgi:hypothetical protein
MPPPITTIFHGSFWSASRSNKLLSVYFDGTGEWCNPGPGSDDNILRVHTGLAALVELHRNRVRRHKGGSPFDIVDLVLLEEMLDALRGTLYDIILDLEHQREVQLNAFNCKRLFVRLEEA